LYQPYAVGVRFADAVHTVFGPLYKESYMLILVRPPRSMEAKILEERFKDSRSAG